MSDQQVISRGAWDLIHKISNVECSDGKRRVFTTNGIADTFFSLPGRVKVNGKTVTGFVMYDSNEKVYSFHANKYGKNHDLLP